MHTNPSKPPAISRRQFLKSTAALGAASLVIPPLTGCQTTPDQAKEATPSVIIDTHTHFYDPSRPEGIPWPPPNDALLFRKVLPRNYQALPVPHPVSGTVVVEASPWLEDNQWVLDLAAEQPFIVGMVGNLKPGQPDFAAHLKRFAANPLYRGIRIPSGSLRQNLNQADFVDDLKRLADADLELDLNGPAAALPDISRLADMLPKLRIVINHLANIPINGTSVDPTWRQAMTEAGSHPNIYAKVSGLVEGACRVRPDEQAPVDPSYYTPQLDVLWVTFGEDRLIYGSNWPVSERFAELATVQSIVTAYFTVKGRTALNKVFAKNAATAYRWVHRG